MEVAVKTLKEGGFTTKNEFMDEAETMKKIRHPKVKFLLSIGLFQITLIILADFPLRCLL